MEATSSEVQNRFGRYLDEARLSPLFITKMSQPVAVMMSNTEYERLCAYEDAYWLAQAREGEASGFIGTAESMQFLKSNLSDA